MGKWLAEDTHCFMVRSFDFISTAAALWKDIRFTSERHLRSILSEGTKYINNNVNSGSTYITKRTLSHCYKAFFRVSHWLTFCKWSNGLVPH